MSINESWHFKCKRNKESGGYILENSSGMLAGRVVVEYTGNGIKFTVINSRNEVTLQLETAKGRDMHAVVLAPRRAVMDAKNGLAVYGVIDRKVNGFDTVYEYESSTGSEVLRVIAEGFPRRLIIRKDDAQVAEIKKERGEITVNMERRAKDTDVLIIIGIMIAICLLMPMQVEMRHGTHTPAVLIG